MKTKRQGISASAFMAHFSAAGPRIDGPKMCCNCKLNRARWDSIYCSDHCKQQLHNAIREGK